jgi:hypothetical protein
MAFACDGGSDGGTTGAGGAGADGTGGAVGTDGGAGGASGPSIADLCPEIVEAGCETVAAFLPDAATCATLLPMGAAVCGTEMQELVACTGPDPEITCDSTTGAPTSEGCEAEWGGVMTCVAALMSQGGGGASGAGGAGG